MVIANIVCFILVVLGALNWGLVGIFNFNLVTAIFGAYPSVMTIILYILIAIASIWLIISAVSTARIAFKNNNRE